MSNPPITIGPFDNVPAPGSPIRSDWAQEITQYVVDWLAGARVDGGFARVGAHIMAAIGSALFVPVDPLPYPTRMYVQASVQIASDSSALTGGRSAVNTIVGGTNQPPTEPSTSTGAGSYVLIPLVWSWALPANVTGQYDIQAIWSGGTTGTVYAAVDSAWQRYRQ